MPLHVNLYHEVQQQELARQRDPLRLGMLIGLIIATGFAANYFVVLERAHSIGVRFTDIQGEWAAIEPKAKDAKARAEKLDDEITASNAVMKRVDSRFYWAPVLDEILKTVPRSVQLTHVGADAPSDAPGTSSVLTLSGISGAAEPRKEAETVRIALEARLAAKFKHVTSVFKMLDDSDQYVMLDGRRLPTAAFTLEFQIETQDPVVAAPAPARRSKSGASE